MLNIIFQQSRSFVARVVVSFISVIVSIVIVRFYNKSDVSHFFLFISYTTFLSQVFLLGMTPFLNILAANKVDVKDIYREVMRKLIFSLPVTVILTFILLEFFGGIGLYQIIGATVLAGFSNILTELMKGDGSYIKSQLYNGGVTNIIFVFLLVLFKLVNFDKPLLNIISVYLLSNILAMIFNFYSWEKRYRKNICHRIMDSERILFSRILPIYLSTVFVYLFSQIDLWFVSKFFESNIVAQYGLAIRLAALLSFSTLSVRAIAASRIPKLIHDRQSLQNEIKQSCKFSLAISVVTLVFLIVFGKWVISFVYGSDYALAWYILIFFSFGQLINAASGPCDFLLSHTGHGIALMWITIFCFLLLIVLFVCIYMSGVSNVFYFCMSVSIVIAMQNIITVYIAYKKTGVVSLPFNIRVKSNA